VPRPCKIRRVHGAITGIVFRPAGKIWRGRDVVRLQLDELEALRLAHLQDRTQEESAAVMGVSRSTFSRILERASCKVAEALVERRALVIEGGPIKMAKMRKFRCTDCGHEWESAFGTGRPDGCPQCNSDNFHRIDSGPRQVGCRTGGPIGGRGRGGGQRRGQ